MIKPTLKPHTYEDYTNVYRLYIYPTIGAVRLDRLITPHCQAMVNDLLRRLSVLTMCNAYARLHAMLDIAVQWKYILYNVADGVKLPKVPYNEPEPLNVEQVARLLAAAVGHRLAALYHLALILSLRKGELLGLRWLDLNWDAATLKISQQIQVVGGKTPFSSPKTERSRRLLPVPPTTLSLLREHWAILQGERQRLDTDWREHGLIFSSEVGTPMFPRNLSRQFYRVRDAAGLPPINFHLLRHTCRRVARARRSSPPFFATAVAVSPGAIPMQH